MQITDEPDAFRRVRHVAADCYKTYNYSLVEAFRTLAQIPLGSTRLDTFDFVEPVERVETSVSSETSRAVPTWRTTNKL